MEGNGAVAGIPWPRPLRSPAASSGRGASPLPAAAPLASPAGAAAHGRPAGAGPATGPRASHGVASEAGAARPDAVPGRDEPGDPDAGLLAGLRAGEPDALHRLAEEWAPRLYRYAARLGADPESARDLTQEALLRALRSLRSGRVPDRLGPWLYTILTNLVRDEARSAYRQRVDLVAPALDGPAPWSTVAVEPAGAAAGGLGADPADVVARRDAGADQARRLRAALLALPLPWRQVVVLRVLEERPVAEVAALLGVAEGTVKSRLHRALKALRRALEPADGPGEGIRP